MTLTRVPMPIPAIVRAKAILTPKFVHFSMSALGINEKSKGNRLSSVATVAIPKCSGLLICFLVGYTCQRQAIWYALLRTESALC